MTPTRVQINAAARFLKALGADLDDPNFIETPRRFAEFFSEHFISENGVTYQLKKYAKSFPTTYTGMVTELNTKTVGICPHHVLPIIGTVHVAYIPNGQAIGLSKIPRIVKLIASLPLLQEDATSRIADALEDALNTRDVAVVFEGIHSCMVIRGVEERDAKTITAEMRGLFAENDAGAKAEFYSHIERGTR